MPLHLHPPACLQAERVSCTEEDGVLIAAFGEKDAGTGDAPYLLLQRAVRPAAHAQERGTDAPYLEISSQLRSVYGHVSLVHLAPTGLRIDLDLDGARAVRATSVEVRLQPQPERYPQLAASIRRIFDGVCVSCE